MKNQIVLKINGLNPIIRAWFKTEMYPVTLYGAKTHKSFFTQDEFEANRGDIFRITAKRQKLEDKFKKETQKLNRL